MKRVFSVLALLPFLACSSSDGERSDPAPVSNPGGATSRGEVLAVDDLSPEEVEQRREEEATARADRLRERRAKLKDEPADILFERGVEHESAQDFKDAADAFTALVVHHPEDPRAADAAARAMADRFRMNEYAEGLSLAEDALFLIEDELSLARLERVVGNAYLSIPHWGSIRGGELVRGQWHGNKQTQTFRADRRRAIEHLEAMRERVLALSKAGALDVKERDEALHDLVSAVARFTPFDSNWSYWWYGWAESADDDKVEEEGEDEHAGEYRWGWDWQLQQTQPKGLAVSPDGKILFTERPAAYRADLDDTSKIKFLLHELEHLDTSKEHEAAAQALLRQALFFRTRDGVERLDRLRNWWFRGTTPFQKEVEGRSLHTLKDDEVLGLVATHLQVYTVPEDESFPRLVRRLRRDYPGTAAADEAAYLLGQYYQSRAQYDLATVAYAAHVKETEQGGRSSSWASSSRYAIEALKTPELGVVEMGVQPAGVNAKLNVRFRNLEQVRFEVREIDRAAYVKAFKAHYANGRTSKGWEQNLVDLESLGSYLFHDSNNYLSRFTKRRLKDFERTLKPDPSGRYADTAIETPLKEDGLYVLDAKTKDGSHLGRGLVLIEKTAVVKKYGPKGPMLWVVDARDGKPIPGATVEVFEYWNDWKDDHVVWRSRSRTAKTDKDGIASPGRTDYSTLTTVRHGGTETYVGLGYWWSQPSTTLNEWETVSLVTTDRPVYRPGDTVELKVWAREKRGGQYRPASEVENISVVVYDAQGNQLLSKAEKAGEFGSASFSLTLGDEAALGMYRVDVHADGNWTNAGGGSFRVEEYKAPEFTVSVESGGDARLGDAVPVKIKAEYLFGGAVEGGKVTYKVYRQDHRHEYTAPGPWDWLYGAGYGRCFYRYAWFDWWLYEAPAPVIWYPWWGPPPEPAKELIQEGEGRLDKDGMLAITVDTAAMKEALGKTDHKLVVKAEVTDLSRRLIKGEGSVLVTRNSYFAHVEVDRGWYAAGDAVGLLVATQKTDEKLFETKGSIVVERVLYRGESGATVSEEVVETLPVTTSEHGPVRVSWKAPQTGQYKFSFVGKDDKGAEVRASTVAWVAGPGFHGRAFRMNGIEVYTDKRVYAVGDVAKLLINVDKPGASVLLSTRSEQGYLLEPRVITVEGKSTIIEIPIEGRDVPNFFVEAITVGDAEVHEDVREVFVPPQNVDLKVSVEGLKPEYGPGDEVELVVRTKDGAGNPVAADLSLSIYDSAVLYIQPELTPDIRAHFWARKRSHSLSSESNLSRKLYYGDQLAHPDRQAAWSLASASQRVMQADENWRYRSAGIRGADALKQAGRRQAASNEPNADDEDLSADKDIPRDEPAEAEAPAAAPAPSIVAGAKSEAGPKRSRAMEKESKKAAVADEASAVGGAAAGRGGAAAPANKVPTVRKSFADTAHFSPAVRTGKDGVAKVKFKLPDNLTTWKVKAIGMSAAAEAGQAETTFKSTKKILVRLQAPRFFRERDRVVLSAVVHNKYKTAHEATVKLDVSEDLLVPEGPTTVKVKVPAEGETRVDFWVKVKGEGEARVRMDALTPVESDAKEMRFPVLVHGLTKTISQVGSIPMGEGVAEKSLTLDIPADRREDLSTLHVRFSPSLAGGMLDALPYLLDYPYGCTEQTLSRFVPAVLTRKTLQQAGGLKLEDLEKMTNLNPQELTPGGKASKERNDARYAHLDRSPVFNTALMDDMIKVGLKRLAKMQNSDGGWGWWGRDGSSRYTTAHVVDGLLDAESADLALPSNMLYRGKDALRRLVDESLWYYDRHDWVGNDDAYAAYVMSRYKEKNDKLNDYLFKRRQTLSTYGKVLAALTFWNLGEKARAKTILRNVEQVLKVDTENETAWLETNQDGWWYWYNNDIETNALYLRALDAFGDEDKERKERAPWVIKWLLNNRKNGYYWRSTRDTARVIAAFAGHMQKSQERKPDFDLEVLLDGKVIRSVHIDKKNLLTFDGEIVLAGKELTSGSHTLTFRRKGTGSVYFNSYLSYFSTEEDVKEAGLEVKVHRTYYKLERDDRELKGQDDLGRARTSKQVAYRKVPLGTGAHVKSGDLVLVELMLESKNDYTFLAFEDPKPAGFEPVALRSGHTYGEAVANMELRDEKVVFFMRTLPRGKTKLSYRLRAEIPGDFHAMPTFGFGMYAPELRTNSDEMRCTVEESDEH